ncbi:MAG: transcriptional regulator [Crocinitomicaceae bacterium]|nr:transcriptional regulator [Crocinitomicaceae bacterium]|tara:strand:+ start:7358 stop:8158 length:801 start_codon:yes stop_codon:yes gene_type:complete
MYIAKNLKFIRKRENLTQSDFAKKIGINRSLVGAYEEGRAEPKLKTLMTIAKLFAYSLDSLVSTELEKVKNDDIYRVDVPGNSLRILPIAIDRGEDRELVSLVPIKAAAGYTAGYGDVDYIESLPRFMMPFPELPQDRTYRVFQIQGESMLPLLSGSYILCEYVQDWKSIRSDECYVLLTKDDGVVYKRVINRIDDGQELLLKSDNPKFEPFAIPVDQVLEIWKAVGYTSFQLPDGNYQPVGMQELTQLVMEMKRELDDIRPGRVN